MNLWREPRTMSLLLIAILLLQWMAMNFSQTWIGDLEHVREGLQLTDDDEVSKQVPQRETTRSIPTGIFVQSIKFLSATEVNLSGYVWQRYNTIAHRDWFPLSEHGVGDDLGVTIGGARSCDLQHAPNPWSLDPDSHSTAGFILPDQVDTSGGLKRLAYVQCNRQDLDGDNEVQADEFEVTVGWYVEATLRQPFEYTQYPFDHKNIWVRMWPQQFFEDVVLVPDLASYPDGTALKDVFGIERDIVLGTWERENTFFNYRESDYTTTFGIDNYLGRHDFPELHFNFVVKRKFINAFVVHLLPLFLVAALLYAALLTITSDKVLAGWHGFSSGSVISTCSALFFVVLLSHIQLREQFAGSPIVYMEWFYFFMYGLLIAAAAYGFKFAALAYDFECEHDQRLSAQRPALLKLFGFEDDSACIRQLYWPGLLLVMVTISLFFVVAPWVRFFHSHG